MKVNVDIELWDNMSKSQIETMGLNYDVLKKCYEESFMQLINKLQERGMEYTLNVEIEDNTIN